MNKIRIIKNISLNFRIKFNHFDLFTNKYVKYHIQESRKRMRTENFNMNKIFSRSCKIINIDTPFNERIKI